MTFEPTRTLRAPRTSTSPEDMTMPILLLDPRPRPVPEFVKAWRRAKRRCYGTQYGSSPKIQAEKKGWIVLDEYDEYVLCYVRTEKEMVPQFVVLGWAFNVMEGAWV